MKIKKFVSGLGIFATVAAFAACSDSKGEGDGGGGNDYDYSATISTYVSDVVIPTYAQMKDKSWALLEAAQAFSEAQTQANLNAVCNAWLDVRAPWELSEAFLFGPCDVLGVDPNIDTWPFDMDEFNNKISSSEPLTVANLCGYTETTRGYHTIEYLIFKEGNPKNITVNPLQPRELQYLVSAATVLNFDCIRVWAAWHGMTGVSAKDQGAIDAMKAAGYWDVEDYFENELGFASYSYVFNNAKYIYTSKENVIEEMIDGCREIATEVSDGKILTPYEEVDVTKVESHYAYNSLVDFTNNMYSIRNAYYGSMNGTISANSLSAFVTAQEGGAAIDTKIKNCITNAVNKINNITAPFATNLDDSENIEAAAAACAELELALARIKTLM